MKKALSLMLILAIVVALFAGFASASADDPIVLEVYSQDGEEGTPVLEESYTAAQLDALKLSYSYGYGYLYYKLAAWNAVAVTEYVPLFDIVPNDGNEGLLADAGVVFDADDYLDIYCSDTFSSQATYEQLATCIYGIDGALTPLYPQIVPAGIALTWSSGSLSTYTFAQLAAAAVNTGSLRFVYGNTEDQYTYHTAFGSRMPRDVISITVVQI